MAWSFGDGFDCYAAATDAINGYWDSGTVIFTLDPGRFLGSRAMTGANNTALLVKSSGSNDAVHHIVVAFSTTAAIAGTNLGQYLQLGDGATGQCAIVFRSDGAILLTSGTAAGATLATYAGAFTAASTWYAFEFEVIINSTTGRFRVRKNGNAVDDFDSGAVLNTRGGTANNYANRLTVGRQATVAQTFDDLFWRSDASSVAWMGDIRCFTRMPASDASVQFSRTPTGVLTQTVPTTAVASTSIFNTVARFTQFTAAYSGTVTGVGVAVSTGNSGNMKCAIYADNAGAPGTVLASATAPVTPVVGGTNAFTFSPGVSIVKGTAYWMTCMCDTTVGSYTQNNTSAATSATASASYATFPQANPVVTIPSSQTQFSWTYTATPANWQAVSEAQQDATTSYVYDSTPGHADFYGVASIASTPVSTIALVTRAYMQKSDAGTRTAAVQLKSGAAAAVASPTLVLTTSGWQWTYRMDLTDPNTSAAWTAAAVNNVTVGPTVIA